MKKAESQVQVLLKETILALCKNTLLKHREISIDGLLGITLDQEEVLLVAINEVITKGKPGSEPKSRSVSRERSAVRDSRSESRDSRRESVSKSQSQSSRPASRESRASVESCKSQQNDKAGREGSDDEPQPKRKRRRLKRRDSNSSDLEEDTQMSSRSVTPNERSLTPNRPKEGGSLTSKRSLFMNSNEKDLPVTVKQEPIGSDTEVQSPHSSSLSLPHLTHSVGLSQAGYHANEGLLSPNVLPVQPSVSEIHYKLKHFKFYRILFPKLRKFIINIIFNDFLNKI